MKPLTMIVALASPSPWAPSIDDQMSALSKIANIVIKNDSGSAKSFEEHASKIVDLRLQKGDAILFYNIFIYPSTTATLIKFLHNLISKGVAVHFYEPPLIIDPANIHSDSVTLLGELHSHTRFVTGMATRVAAQGRERNGPAPKIAPERIPEIRELLSKPGASPDSVAKSLGISRSTLYNYLRRKE